MNRIYLFLMPVLLFAQLPKYADKVITFQGREFDCTVTQIDEEKVKIFIGSSVKETYLISLKSINLNGIGEIYKDGSFTLPKEQYAPAIQKRNEVLQKVLSPPVEVAKAQPNEITDDHEEIKQTEMANEKPRFFIGFTYYPYATGQRSVSYSSNNEPYYDYYENFATKINTQFGICLNDKLILTFDVGYASSNNYDKETYHYYYSDGIYETKIDDGDINKMDLSVFDIAVGVKYHFLLREKVKPFVSFSFGKSFASYSGKDENLYNHDNSTNTTSDNLEEYISDQLSPYNISFGIGAEYFINKSLSFSTSAKVIRSASSAKYDYRSISSTSNITRSRKIEQTVWSKEVGVGFNFYF